MVYEWCVCDLLPGDGPVTSVENILEAFSINHAARELVEG